MVRLLKNNRGETVMVWILLLALGLTAGAHHADAASAPPPPFYIASNLGWHTISAADVARSSSTQRLVTPGSDPPLYPSGAVSGNNANTSMFSHGGNFVLNLPSHFSLNHRHHDGDCRFVDRFDRRAALAYNFDTNHQLALKMGIHNDGGLNVSHARLAFNYRFNDIRAPMLPEKKDKCRYASAWQGEIGSVTNELLFRDRDSLWSDLSDRGVDFWH